MRAGNAHIHAQIHTHTRKQEPQRNEIQGETQICVDGDVPPVTLHPHRHIGTHKHTHAIRSSAHRNQVERNDCEALSVSLFQTDQMNPMHGI